MAEAAERGANTEAGLLERELRFVLDLVDRAMLGVQELPPELARDAPWQAAAAARSALQVLVDRPPLDEDYLDHFDAGSAQLEALSSELDQTLGSGRWTGPVETAIVHLQGLRDHVVDLRVDHAATLGAGEPDAAGGARSFRVSTGRPELRKLTSIDLSPFHARFIGAPARTDSGDGEPDGGPDQLEQTAERSLASLGATWRCRRVEGDRPWHAAVPRFEQRLLDQLDGFVTLAGLGLAGELIAPAPTGSAGSDELAGGCDIVAVLARYTGQSQNDQLRAFAQSFVLCSLAGSEPLRMAVMGLRHAHPSTFRAHADALALAPHPAIPDAMEELSSDPDSRLVAVALDVLRRRRQCRFEVLAPLLGHPEDDVRRFAVRALAHSGNREAAVALLEASVEVEFDEQVVAAAAETLLRLDHPRGLSLLRARLTEERHAPHGLVPQVKHDMMRLLALAGSSEDLDLLLSLAQTPTEVSLIGWHGHGAGIEALLAVLGERPSSLLLGGALGETRPQAAARALQRITGAMGSDDEHGEDDAPERASPFARVDAVTTHAERWRQWYADHRDELSYRTKYRFGLPFEPRAPLEELLRAGVPWDVRELAELEVALVAGADAASLLRDVEDWTAAQRDGRALMDRHFAKHEDPAARTLHTPGEWPADRLGTRHQDPTPD